MSSVLSKIAEFVRWRDWGPGKIPVFCFMLAYIALANRDFSATFIVNFVLFVLFASLHSALGYVVNDWGDREIDKLQGKANAFENIGYSIGIGALATLLILAFISGLPFVLQPMFVPLWVGWLFFTFAYSLKPLRLKVRGIWGLGVSAIAQWSLPILITFAAMGRFGNWDMIVFTVASSISGATLEVAHQRWDRARDISTHTKTLGTRTKKEKLDRLYSIALYCDKFALGTVLIIISLGIVHLFSTTIWIGLSFLLPTIYLILLPIALYEFIRAEVKGNFLDPYYSVQNSVNKVLHETMPNLIIPGYLLLLLTIFQPVNGVLLVVFLYWRLIMGEADWQWPFRAMRKWLS